MNEGTKERRNEGTTTARAVLCAALAYTRFAPLTQSFRYLPSHPHCARLTRRPFPHFQPFSALGAASTPTTRDTHSISHYPPQSAA